MFPFFLSSGLFLGWSLGANDASNVFGTAVGSGMVKFRTAALICAVFVTAGAVLSGAGASHTLGKLGAVNALAGAFMVALSAALTVYAMTVAKYPVSTSQAIVGAIIGWNFFSGSLTDPQSLSKIMLTWVACPVLSAIFSVTLYKMVACLLKYLQPHMITLDMATRWGLILAGAFGSFSLGANNIANVMGVFIPVSPFHDLPIANLFVVTGEQQLFFLGGLAIAVGVFTYSKRVMMTVGSGILPLSPVGAFVVVTAHSLVLFVFSSKELSQAVASAGLPPIPLVPVSSSQAIVGAVIGLGLLKGGRGIRWRTLAGIASSWITTPLLAALVCFICLFFLQNVFDQKTYTPVHYEFSPIVWEKLAQETTLPEDLLQKIETMQGEEYPNAQVCKDVLQSHIALTPAQRKTVLGYAEKERFRITPKVLHSLDPKFISTEEIAALQKLQGHAFTHRWRFAETLAEISDVWKVEKGNKAHNTIRHNKLRYLYDVIRRVDIETNK